MPWALLFAGIFALVALFAIAAGLLAKERGIFVGGGAVMMLAILIAGLDSFTIVSTRNVGVVTEFGKPVGTLSNGIHPVAPWKRVTELSGVIHTDSQVGGWNNGKCDNGTAVRLANNSTACVDNTIRWRIVPEAGDTLFRDYQNDNNIKDSLVTRELNAVLNGVFATYNPLDPSAANGPNLTDLSKTVTDQLKEKVKTQIDVQNVIISLVNFDAQTQEKINGLQAQIANTRIAEESKRTAASQAEANRILADSVRGDGVNTARCLELVNSGKQLPVGFQCFPGGVPLSIPVR
ncbi:SPFH domain-containing protein [Nocardia vinacea]|uniref:SPFH domain-containing protein n=1 Tax=Nocardia vinacea TaxID=96468 RepID=UPI0033EC8FCE